MILVRSIESATRRAEAAGVCGKHRSGSNPADGRWTGRGAVTWHGCDGGRAHPVRDRRPAGRASGEAGEPGAADRGQGGRAGG